MHVVLADISIQLDFVDMNKLISLSLQQRVLRDLPIEGSLPHGETL